MVVGVVGMTMFGGNNGSVEATMLTFTSAIVVWMLVFRVSITSFAISA